MYFSAQTTNLTDYCTVVTATGSLTISASGSTSATLTFTCPDGYKAILATPKNAIEWPVTWNRCELISQSTVLGIFHNGVSTAYSDLSVTSTVLCIRDI